VIYINSKKWGCNFVGVYVCLDLLTYTREEMNLYLKKGEQCVSECLQRKECVSKYLCVCIIRMCEC
jgi:hypothetical protein